MEQKDPSCYIEQHVFEFNDLIPTDRYRVVKASDLLFNPARFDLMIKYLYAATKLGREQGDLTWLRELFVEQRRYLNNFREANYSGFTTGEQFVEAFDRLIEVCTSSTDPRLATIPVHEDLTPVDGAHRIAVLAALGKEVTLVPFRKKHPRTNYTYDYLFFRRKGMPLEYTDYTALEYVRHAPDVYAMCLFPSCKDKWDDVDSMIRSEVNVYYDRTVALTGTGKLNFIRNLYRTEPWVGTIDDGFKGARWKMEQCFSKEGGIRVYIIVSDTLEKVVSLKRQIREYCQLENHSVHSTDVKATTFELASMTLHAPTTAILNTVEANGFPVFNRLFPVYRQYLTDGGLDRNHFCIDGSAILSACSLRDCRDIDFLTSEDEDRLPAFPEDVDCHNDYTRGNGFDTLLSLSIDSIVLNPRHYFFFEGFKVMSPDLIYSIKAYRNEPKDLVDTNLISTLHTRMDDSGSMLNPDDTEGVYDPRWYGELDSLMTRNGYSLLTGLLNTRLVLPERVRALVSEWEDFNGLSTRFSASSLTYYFELFQLLAPEDEAAFWRVFAHFTGSLPEDDEDIYVDIVSLIRICFTVFSRQNEVSLFESSFSAFLSQPSVMEADLIVKLLNR